MKDKQTKPKAKKVPNRRCVVSGEIHPKKELIRVVRTPEGTVEVDSTGRMKGRGAYITRSREVVMQAMKRHALDRSLETTVPQAVYDALLALIEVDE